MNWLTYSNPTYGFDLKYPLGWLVDEYGGVATDFSDPTIQSLFTVYPSEYDPLTLDELADGWLSGFDITGSEPRSYASINGIPAIQVSYTYFDTTWDCINHSTYVALFDAQTRIFEIDAGVCEDNVGVTQAKYDAMWQAFKP